MNGTKTVLVSSKFHEILPKLSNYYLFCNTRKEKNTVSVVPEQALLITTEVTSRQWY